MARDASVAVLDGTLDIIAGCNEMHACAGQPLNYADIDARSLAVVLTSPGDFTKGAGTPDGRSVTSAQKTDVPITSAGTADHVVRRNTATQAYEITVCPATVFGSGTVTFSQYTSTVRNPTAPA